MTIILGTIVLAVLVGYVRGGSLENLVGGPVRWAHLAFLGLLLQVLPVPRTRYDLPLLLLFVSFGVLLVFTVRNIRLPAFALILVGLSLNFLVIAVNHGMPVPEHTLVESGQRDTLRSLVLDGGAKHHLAGPGDTLLPLADVIAIPPPVHQALSVGDVLSYLGVVWLVVAGMGRRRRRAEAEGVLGTRPVGDSP
jgi:hypothetical protein